MTCVPDTLLQGNKMENSDEKSLLVAKSFLFENCDMPSLIFPVTLWRNKLYKDNSDEKSLVDAKSFLFEN